MMVSRNLIGIVGAAALYAAILYLLHLFEPKGRDALFLLVGLHIGFGVLGCFVFIGSTVVRAVCVFLVVLAFGIGTEIVSPDPRHEFVQVFAATAFGVLAAASTPVGRLLAATWLRSRAASKA